MTRAAALSRLSRMIARVRLDHPVRVGIDGVDASGKTTLADELVTSLQEAGRTVIQASVDGFHNPREIRYRQGRGSPRGYYQDSFNYGAIAAEVLRPLGPGGNLRYRSACFDFRTDSEVRAPVKTSCADDILLFDGVFLHRAELREHWDFSVFVDAHFEVTLERAKARDREMFGSTERVDEIYRQRYIPGQRLYLASESPAQRATVIWNNNDPRNPELTINAQTHDTRR